MSKQNLPDLTEPDPNDERKLSLEKGKLKLGIDKVLFLALIGLSLIGVPFTHVSPALSFWYWLTMVPVFAAIAIITEWERARREGHSVTEIVGVQLAHWGGVLIALVTIFEFSAEGRFTDENAALVILIVVGVATFLDGPHIGWRFYLAGIAIFLMADIVAYFRSVTWLVLLVAVPVILLGLYLEEHFLAPTVRRDRERRRGTQSDIPE
jgi:hypothetical protein